MKGLPVGNGRLAALLLRYLLVSGFSVELPINLLMSQKNKD